MSASDTPLEFDTPRTNSVLCGAPDLDAYEVMVAHARCMERELAAGRARLNDLMAYIHGDGGHHREAVGDEQCWHDAVHVLSKLKQELDRLREQLRLANIDAANSEAEANTLRADAERYQALREQAAADHYAECQDCSWEGMASDAVAGGSTDADYLCPRCGGRVEPRQCDE